jgi:hypothetical protein
MHKSIPFAVHNFGPFEHILFVVVLFDSQSKTLFTVLFSSLYSFSFSTFISIFQSVAILVKSAGYFLTGNAPFRFRFAKTSRVYILVLGKRRKSILKVKLHLQHDLHVHRATGTSYSAILACGTREKKTQNKHFYWLHSN